MRPTLPSLTLALLLSLPAGIGRADTPAPTDPAAILAGYEEARARGRGVHSIPEKWDGKAGERIARTLKDWSPILSC